MSHRPSRIPILSSKRDAILAGLADGAFQLGAAVASRAKKAVPPNPSKQGKAEGKKGKTKVKNEMQATSLSMTRVAAPVSQAFTTSSGGPAHRHTPFIVSGATLMGSISTDSGSGLTIRNAGSILASTLKFCVDPVGSSGTAANFQCLPAVIRNVALSFVRYRWRKFKITYVSTCPTSTPGTICLGSSPEVVNTNDTANYGIDIVSFSRNITTPTWSTQTFDCHGHDGIDNEWYYVDPSIADGESNLRQECAGSLFVGSLGGLPASTNLGYLRLEYAIEFEALQNTGLFSAKAKAPAEEKSVGNAIVQPASTGPSVSQSLTGQASS